MPNRRKSNKWVIQKNNKSWEGHRLYVAYVLFYKKINGNWPTEKIYLDEILPFVRKYGVPKKEKAQIVHQLYSPIFYGFLKYENEFVIPTDLGISVLIDSAEIQRDKMIFVMAMNFASLGNGAQGDVKFSNIYPLREIIINLLKYKELTFDDLNGRFYYENPNTLIENVLPHSRKKRSRS